MTDRHMDGGSEGERDREREGERERECERVRERESTEHVGMRVSQLSH